MEYFRALNEERDLIAYIGDCGGVSMPVAHRFAKMVRFTWGATQAEVETMGIAMDAVPIVMAKDIAIIMINQDKGIETWGF